MNQLVSKSIIIDEVVDIYQSWGFENPDLFILSDKFLENVQDYHRKMKGVKQMLDNTDMRILDELSNRITS